MQFLANVLIVVLALAAQMVHFSRRVTVSVPTSPLMVPMLVDHCCVLTDSLPASDLFGFSRRDLPLRISAVALKLWLAHADDQRDEFALGTVNATMALHGGQCQGLLTSCSASSAIVQRGVDEWKTTGRSPSRASAIDL